MHILDGNRQLFFKSQMKQGPSLNSKEKAKTKKEGLLTRLPELVVLAHFAVKNTRLRACTKTLIMKMTNDRKLRFLGSIKSRGTDTLCPNIRGFHPRADSVGFPHRSSPLLGKGACRGATPKTFSGLCPHPHSP